MDSTQRDQLSHIRSQFMAQYDNDGYRREDGTWRDDEDGFGHGAAAEMLRVADDNLTGNARDQFCRAYSFEAALEGGVYVGGGVMAKVNYPDLVAQARAVGSIRLFGRGDGFERMGQ